ncbi:Peptidase A1 domain-containing protein [Mycena venus]|uniref:Peptidase A1 domain-containing protein n=1 Tax=Mycena venus TaxID=2733690 RepID=A0A8H7CQ43_9AGAR|nr:Peptidase A1 domain-containing protein [Mycena venus]
MWLSSACTLLFGAASPSLALVLRVTPNPSHAASRAPIKGRFITASSVPAVNASGTLEPGPQLYVTSIKLNDQEFRVGIDTGSSDLVLITSANFQYDTEGALPIRAGYGSANLTGTSGFAQMQLGDYVVARQAFMNITSIEGTLGTTSDGAQSGILGLAFSDPAASPLTTALQGNVTGQPFLFNVFDQQPAQNNFIAISLSRTDDLEDSAEATFTIMELEATYAAVADTTPVPLFPPDTDRWSVLVDSINVDGVDIPLSSVVPRTPKGKLATLPADVLYALYSQIPGATVSFNDNSMYFAIPCNTTSIVTVVIGGEPYPIHPLDLSSVVPLSDDDGPGLNGTGDTFMRNTYSVFNFGNAAAKTPGKDASIQLLSLTDPTAAAADVQNVRMAALAAVGESEVVYPGFQPATPGSTPPAAPDSSAGGTSTQGVNNAAFADAAVPQGNSTSSSNVKQYALIIIGLLGGNLLVALILAVIGVALCIKKGTRTGSSKYVPVRLRDSDSRKPESYEEGRRYSD